MLKVLAIAYSTEYTLPQQRYQMRQLAKCGTVWHTWHTFKIRRLIPILEETRLEDQYIAILHMI